MAVERRGISIIRFWQQLVRKGIDSDSGVGIAHTTNYISCISYPELV